MAAAPARAARDAPARAGGEPARAPGSLPYMPGIAGLILAGEVIRDLCAGK